MKHAPVRVEGQLWRFEHLDPFSFPYEIVTAGARLTVFIDVVFSCHCFSRKPEPGALPPPDEWVYRTRRETRILDEKRYRHSRRLLPLMLKDLDSRRILFARNENFMTVETVDDQGCVGHYQVFFTVKRKEGLRHRLELTVQSAYFVADPHRRARPDSLRPVRFKLIVTAAYERRKLRLGR